MNNKAVNFDLFGNEILKDDLLSGWERLGPNKKFEHFYSKIEVAEYFNSLIYSQVSGMYYKIMEDILFFAKPVFNFKLRTITLYTTPISLNKTKETKQSLLNKFSSRGFSLRGLYDNGTRDSFGEEYVYECDEFIKMKGKSYSKHRNRLRSFFKNSSDYKVITDAYNSDILKIIDVWSDIKGNNSQKKLYKTILKNQDKCSILTTYYKSTPIGFSVVENINKKNGVIIQRLINYNSLHKGEINFILHYNDCLINKGKFLNIGASRNKEIKISKKKLCPKLMLGIKRIKSEVKVSEKTYNLIRGKYE